MAVILGAILGTVIGMIIAQSNDAEAGILEHNFIIDDLIVGALVGGFAGWSFITLARRLVTARRARQK
jgi:hypothetical protein